MSIYTVSGAGSADYNGTYTESGTYNSNPLYVKDSTHYLYYHSGGLETRMPGGVCLCPPH